MLIAMTNTKGGTGKSTLAAHLAIWLFDRGVSVGLLDSDVQETAARWVRGAEPLLPVRTAIDAPSIQQARRELFETVSVVVADTPGVSNEAAQVVALLADLAIVPLQPSKPDLRAISEAIKFIRVAQEIRGRPELMLVLTFTAKGDRQTRRLRQQLAEHHLPVAQAEVRRLNAFRDACDSAVTRLVGRDAMAAAQDVELLFTELLAGRLVVPPAQEVVHA